MDFLTDQLQLFGLNDREVRVFTALATFGRMNMTAIASRSGLPRTTVDYIVRSLLKQKLVLREKVGGHYEYVVPLVDVAANLDSLEKKLVPGGGSVDSTEGPGVHATVGAHAHVREAYGTHKGERVTLLLASLPTERDRFIALEHYFAYARQNETKLEILTSKDVADDMTVYAKEILALLCVPHIRINILPAAYCLPTVDVTAFRDMVLMIDHTREHVEHISGRLGVEAIKHLLFVARETAWSIDIQLFLAGYVDVKRKT